MFRNKENKGKHRILKAIGKFILSVIIIIVLFVAGFVGYSVYKNGWGWKSLLQTFMGQSEADLQNLEEFKVLILGVSEDISAQLTDTIIVASYNPQTQKATLLSIPRDTFVGDSRLSANSYDKLNAIYQQRGPEGTLSEVNELTGLNIEYYIVISNNALVELVDEIGGVQFDVPTDMNYDSQRQDLHIHLSAGLQTLNGEQAEGLVRFRKNNNGTTYSSEYGNDDYGRMKTQRDFLKAVANQTLKAKNITKIGSLADIMKQNVTTNIPDWSKVKNYIPYAVEFNMDNLQTETIPGESTRIPAGTGLWFFLANEKETHDLVEELFVNQNTSDTQLADGNTISQNTGSSNTLTNTSSKNTSSSSSTTSNSNVKIEILNGSGVSRKLTEVTNDLKKSGYNVYKTGTTSITSKTTIINKSNISKDITSDIKDILDVGIIQNSSTNNGTVDITIILGKDYK